ncbi:MAG TPA: type II toxin-antitoxin system mRNA interferase toxin, RelE/StbE family [Desulfobulbaceae bacterium]|nr:MAG: addiction module toxin RelE [Deltaproteobacteria bacterium RIFOXYD12_FULL_53_23]HCC55173.1 type II toxin-antitoxin system mRNA interferase toxin, RelE/StbE family [Desulfobulbaceae bacterium]
MSYELEFKTTALKEWRKLDSGIREQFKKRLAARLAAPHVVTAKVLGLPDCYKIKLRDVGYRLVYQVVDDRLLVVVIAVGRRDHDQVYRLARTRV